MDNRRFETKIFQQLNIAPVINACGVYTDLGGSILSPRVWTAMQEINSSFVKMTDLLDASGDIIANLLSSEAARITPGASAAIALGTAACMTGMNGKAWERLPDTTDTKNEVLIQRGHRYKYDRCARIAGAVLVEVGSERETTGDQIAAQINSNTAAILFPAHLDGVAGTLSLRDTLPWAHRQGIPVFVDAAYLSDPVERMHEIVRTGADLVCFSSKYFGGPNSGGFICGRKQLITALAGLDFTRYESGQFRTFGRVFKMDRQIIVGVLVALQEWMSMDHRARWEEYNQRVSTMIRELRAPAGISISPKYFTMDEHLLESPVNCMAMTFKGNDVRTAQQVAIALAEGDPSIVTTPLGNTLIVAVDCLVRGQEYTVAKQLKSVLRSMT